MTRSFARAALADAVARGRADAVLLSEGGRAAELELGGFGDRGPYQAVGLRAALSLRLPPRLVSILMTVLARSAVAPATAEEIVRRYAYWTGVRRSADRATWRALTRGPAILMYHAFDPGKGSTTRLVVSGEEFERQLHRIRSSGRRVITLTALAEAWSAGKVVPAGAVVITMDDAYLDNAEIAAPILARYAYPATVFAVSDALGGSNTWDSGELRGRQLLDPAGLRAFRAAGHSVGAHTRSHRALPALDEDALEDEVAGSRAALAALLDAPITEFAYPHGKVDAASIEAVRRAGYACAVGIERGLNDARTPLYALRRTQVSGSTGRLGFELALRFGDADILRHVRRGALSRRPIQEGRALNDVVDVTVAISTRDRPGPLERCLRSLAAGDAIPAEIVVSDQSDGPETEALVTKLSATVQIRYVRSGPGGLATAQNDAVAAAAFPIVAILDDDCVADARWLATIDRVLRERPDLELLTGRVLPLGPAEAGRVAVSSRTSEDPVEFGHPCIPWLVGSGNNFAVRRDTFLRIGGNDARLGPGSPGKGGVDMDLFYRLVRDGGRARYEPESLVLHARATPAARLARRIPYGYGIGACVAILVREGDRTALRVLATWLGFRGKLASRSIVRLRLGSVREEILVLIGTLRGIGYGIRVAKPMRRT